MAHRTVFIDTWHRFQQGAKLSDFEMRLAGVMQHYPNYTERLHLLQEGGEPGKYSDNPFLLMGAHFEVGEQIAQDRPGGVRAVYQRLVGLHGEVGAQLLMRDVLIDLLSESYSKGEVPDYSLYIIRLKKC
ncbi:MAG: DUF1841 family protein [Pseudomonadota bacterium]|nr:DUF1841 family protein [Pseudomonadota bacterium]